MKNQKMMTVSTLMIILVSFLFLSITESLQHRYKSGWFLYFEDPKNDSLEFVIENYSDIEDFSWSLIVDGKEIKTENIEVLKNSRKNVIIEKSSQGRSFVLEARNSKGIKEIYKMFKQ